MVWEQAPLWGSLWRASCCWSSSCLTPSSAAGRNANSNGKLGQPIRINITSHPMCRRSHTAMTARSAPCRAHPETQRQGNIFFWEHGCSSQTFCGQWHMRVDFDLVNVNPGWWLITLIPDDFTVCCPGTLEDRCRPFPWIRTSSRTVDPVRLHTPPAGGTTWMWTEHSHLTQVSTPPPRCQKIKTKISRVPRKGLMSSKIEK